ncbi:hypothetical protein L2E82_19698 [Cichorium intybus]|uniref:Uncharacterized protein n=1 Tax=Cichorium intybus TaxID=13427 RepID=A0ACB9FCT0_CICIN|nr:hypothetical protein L2E82_19698 [Cichorium intybus]
MLAVINPNLKVFYTVDNPSKYWVGGEGYISTDMALKGLPVPSEDTLILVRLSCTGREVTTPEIRDALIPCLVEEHGDNFVEVLEYFPIPLVKDEIAQKPPADLLETSQVTNNTETPNLPPHVVYLEELGTELEVIKEVIRISRTTV